MAGAVAAVGSGVAAATTASTVAAGAFIAQRAGAVVTDYSGGGNFIFGREIVAANPLVYDEFIKTVK